MKEFTTNDLPQKDHIQVFLLPKAPISDKNETENFSTEYNIKKPLSLTCSTLLAECDDAQFKT